MPLVNELLTLAQQANCRSTEECEKALKLAAEQQRSLVGAVLDENLVEENKFLQAICEWLGLTYWQTPVTAIAAPLREKVPARIALRHQVLPVESHDNTLSILTFDPFNFIARQAVNQAVPEKVNWSIAPRKLIQQALRQGYGIGADVFEQLLEGRINDDALDNLKQETNVLDAEDPEASVVKFVNQIMREALEQRATDIHVEPLEDDLRIRYRIDGVLHDVPVPPQIKLLQASVISRLKIMAHLDIAERRMPQDGRINLELEGKPIDVRVATIPSVTGESVSLRLLGQMHFDFQGLGLEEEDETKVKSLLKLPNGIILVTGPTGAGKSTTLYTFLSSLNTTDRRIVTIEDPVEHKIPGVIQIAVKPEIDLTFARGLRSILRGDPNVVMVGEMRDLETAEIAIRAALTGHLVLSTLHTNDAIGAITRLIDMGIEPFLVASSVRAFIAQRLVRVLCPMCRTSGDYDENYLHQIGFPKEHVSKIRKAAGCEHCHNTGYVGRTAIMEVCTMSTRMQDLVVGRRPTSELVETALQEGMQTLRAAGWKKVIHGKTTIEEVLRVTTADVEAQDE
ncbi:MAG: GspE/PulE family protein [Verrucomicrobiae bacterium]|nr:GspE/PulE family protein [Verrucomicrobiae bacterium]